MRPVILGVVLLEYFALSLQTQETRAEKREEAVTDLFASSVNEQTCSSLPLSELIPPTLQEGFGQLVSDGTPVTVDPSKQAVQYAKSLVRNRAFFFSMVLQMLNGTEMIHAFDEQPGFLYHYLSAASGVLSGPSDVVASGVFFDTNTSYPNWHRGVYFNATFQLFAPRAVRESEVTSSVDDYGADDTLKYTSRDVYKTNDWFMEWGFPDNGNNIQKEVYSVAFSNILQKGSTSSLSFYGVRSDDAVHVTTPYFDCGRTNQWLVTVSSPVTEVLPRYLAYKHLRKPRYVAVATADLAADALLFDTDEVQVRNVSSQILRYPEGWERDCSRDIPRPGPQELPDDFYRAMHPQFRLALRLAHFLSAFLQNRDPGWDAYVDEYLGELWNEYFESGHPYDQTPKEPAWTMIKMDMPVSDRVLAAETLASVLSDDRILGSGIYFDFFNNPQSDRYRWKGLFAWKDRSDNSNFDARVTDLGSFGDISSIDIIPVRKLRTDWQNPSSNPNLKTFNISPRIRGSRLGGGLTDYAPGTKMEYKATDLWTNYWSEPYLKCNDVPVEDWVVTYAAPFFGPLSDVDRTLVLKGTVTVDVQVTAENWNV